MSKEWKCSNCGGLNPESRSICLGCNSSRYPKTINSTENLSSTGNNDRSKIRFPEICSCCAGTPIVGFWPIFSQYDRKFFIYFSTYKRYNFLVPICKSCKEKLISDSKKWIWVSLLSAIIFIGLSLVSTQIKNYSNVILIFATISLIIAIFGFIKRAAYYGGSNIGLFNGRYFIFKNQEFQRQFNELNPAYVEGGS
jgi:hypothetical protein